jgi:ubiquinone/menaquinone biosynthesis C-methylase UbiE
MTQYGKLCSEFYDLDKPEARPDALEYYLDCAHRCEGPILEPMCGTGRYLLPLLAAGFDIEGTDSSSDMLTLCHARAKALGLTPKLHQGYLEQLDLFRAFGLIFIPSGSFCLLTNEEQVRACLARIHAALLPNGSFVVEVERAGMITPSLSGTWEGRWLERADGSKLIQSWLRQYSGVEGIARHIHRYELVSDGRLVATEFEDLAVKHYERDEFHAFLQNAGFTDIHCYRPYEQVPPDDEDEGLLFECRKA